MKIKPCAIILVIFLLFSEGVSSTEFTSQRTYIYSRESKVYVQIMDTNDQDGVRDDLESISRVFPASIGMVNFLDGFVRLGSDEYMCPISDYSLEVDDRGQKVIILKRVRNCLHRL